MTTRSIRLEPSLTLSQLNAELRSIEAVFGRIRELGHESMDKPCTVATIDDRRFAAGTLKLVLDPAGQARGPAGAKLVCRGTVYVQGALQQVAAFREARARAPSHDIYGDVSDAATVGVAIGVMAGALVTKNRTRAKGAGGARKGPAAAAEKAARKAPAAASRPKPTRAPLAKLEPREYRVWFGTNRAPVDAADIAKGFSSERDARVRYGHCDVYVPASHKIASIGKFDLIRWIKGTDDRLKIRRLTGLADDDFWAGVRGQIEKAAPGARHAVVFIHGYRVSFKDAALKAAQIGSDLGIQGAMGFFSWPSKGKFRSYAADERALEGSEAAIANFLVDFARRSGAEAVHVIAHSMGNRGLLRAANRIVADAASRSECRFGQFILAAADVDADNFRDFADAYKALAKRTTLYVSSKDLAVQLSRWLGGYARVGFHPPVTIVDGIDTVSVANVDLTLLGHGYVAEARPVLQDMERLISTNQPPPRFGQEETKTPDGRRYWNVRA